MATPGKKSDRAILNGGPGHGLLFVGDESALHCGEALPSGFDPLRPEESYREIVDAEHRRQFGQFFTPQPIAELMCSWIAGCQPKHVLDPACGPGIFIREAMRRIDGCFVTAIDVDTVALEAARAALRSSEQVQFVHGDFLCWQPDARFDAALANPPYLKHHNFHYEHDIFAEIGRRNGVTVSRLTNIYVLFIMEICRRLRAGGRAAVIVPGEWVNANYGSALKSYLLRNQLLSVLIYFSHSALVFDEALTTASVLLIEKAAGGDENNDVLISYIRDAVGVQELEALVRGAMPHSSAVLVQRLSAAQLLGVKKWDYILSHVEEEASIGFVALSELAETRRGIATGANDYFHLSRRCADELRIRDQHLLECVGRAVDVPSVVFSRDDFEQLVYKGARTHLLSLTSEPDEAESAYIKEGEERGLPNRYLLAGRTPWYAMEKREPAPIWAAVFGRKGLRFIHNDAGVHNLTTFHCIYPRVAAVPFAMALTAVLNSRRVQDLSKKHRRVYGGGLAKFEPRDLLDILVPDLRRAKKDLLSRLAGSLQQLDAALRESDERAEAVLERLDGLVQEAADQAADSATNTAPVLAPPHRPSTFPLWELQTRRDGQDE